MGKRRSGVFACVLAMLVLFTGMSVLTSSAVNAQVGVGHKDKEGKWQGEPCPDVLVIGARGSGEAPQGDDAVDSSAYANDQFNGMGSISYDVYQNLAASAPQLRIAYEGVQYAAQPVFGETKPALLLSTPSAYAANVNAGAGWMAQEIGLVDAQCEHHTRFVLVGYSQGTWLIHKALNRLSPDRLEEIAGVALFGDPLFSSGLDINRVNKMTATRNGSAYGFDLVNVLIPSGVRDRTGNYCNVPDPICQSHITTSLFAEHTNYKSNGLTKKAAEFIRPFLPGPAAPSHDEQSSTTAPLGANIQPESIVAPTDTQPEVKAQPIPGPVQQVQPRQVTHPEPVTQAAPPPPPVDVPDACWLGGSDYRTFVRPDNHSYVLFYARQFNSVDQIQVPSPAWMHWTQNVGGEWRIEGQYKDPSGQDMWFEGDFFAAPFWTEATDQTDRDSQFHAYNQLKDSWSYDMNLVHTAPQC